MTFALVAMLATLAVIIALNRERFREMGAGNVIRLLLIWGAIIAGLTLVLKLLGY